MSSSAISDRRAGSRDPPLHPRRDAGSGRPRMKTPSTFPRPGPARRPFAAGLLWLLCTSWFFSVAPRLGAADEGTMLRAKVDPRPITLPIVDGTDIRFSSPFTPQELSQTKIYSIVQDDQGFIWFGTQHGLDRYDGYNFKVFVHDPKKPNTLSGVTVRALFKDRDGALWVGCDKFLNKFERATETFTPYPIPFVHHISQDRAGMLWLAADAGLYSLDPATARIRRYSHDPNDPSGLGSNDIDSSGEDKEGRFWVGIHGGLDEFDRQTGRVTLHIPLREPALGVSFHEDRSGRIWVYHDTGPHALAMFDWKTKTLTQLSFDERKLAGANLTGITAALEDQNGDLWFATHGAGLLKFDRDRRRFIRYRNIPADNESLPQNNVEYLFSDREGGLWAALGRMGPVRFSPNPLPFRRVPHNPHSANPAAEPFLGAVYEDGAGSLWTGTSDALNRIDRATGSYRAYHLSAGSVANMNVIAIREDRSGVLWIATYGNGLLRFDRRTGQFKAYRHNSADPYSLSSDVVTRLLVDHHGILWVGAMGGLQRLNASTNRFTTYTPDSPNEKVTYLEIVEDEDGALWLGTETSGLYRFDPETGQFTRRYQHDVNRPETLSDNRVNSVHFDHSGAMWIGTQNGLDKLDRETGQFAVYTRGDGLPGNAVGCVLEDGRGDLWMSTNHGVARFNPQSKALTNYSTADGLPGLDFTGWGACFQSTSGEMFFGGFSGATAFMPEEVLRKRYIPPVILTELRLNGSLVEIGRHSALKQSISATTDLILSHKQNIFSLTFVALSYSNPGTNRYRYMLEPLEHDWNEVGSDQRLATYTTLPAGKYTFRVQGATSSGVWSEPGASLRIEVLPPLWGTWWFRSACAVLLFLSMYAAYSYRLRQIAREFELRTEERVSERTRIARDLHDTLLQSFHGLLLRFQAAHNLLPGRAEDARHVLDTALADAAQAITEARDAVQGLRSSTVVTNDLANAIESLGQELSSQQRSENREASAFSVEVEGAAQDLHPILRDEIYRIAGEALRNAFRHAQARRIEVEITYASRKLRLRVRDDGIGIDASVLNEGRVGHWGIGGMRERARSTGGQLEVWSEHGAGTEVELTIPGSVAYGTHPGRRFRLFGSKARTNS
jgi:ligand-binding sensor domain-containing protein/signal transduction histidine kinase